jgi:hypothetical protein
MKSKILVFVCASICAAFVSTANATTYTYTGLNFSPSDIAVECTSPPCNTVAYTTSDSVTGYFTVPAPLSPNTAYAPLVPTTYSFSDGIQTLTPSNSVIDLFRIYTDASGGFENWVIIIFAYSCDSFGMGFCFISTAKVMGDVGETYLPPDNGSTYADAPPSGRWCQASKAFTSCNGKYLCCLGISPDMICEHPARATCRKEYQACLTNCGG